MLPSSSISVSLAVAGRPEVVFESVRVGPAGCSYFYPSSELGSTGTNTDMYTPEHGQSVANFGPVSRSFMNLSQFT